MADKLAYLGPEWPLRGFKPGDTYPKDSVGALYDSTMALRTTVREKFDRQAEAIREKGRKGILGPVGVQQELEALVATFREHPRVQELQSALSKQREREKELRETLMTKSTPDYEDWSPYRQVSLALSEQRKIAAYEQLDSLERMQAAHAAGERNDTAFLALMLREGLIPEPMSKAVEVTLQRLGDKDTFQRLETLAGKVLPNGERDPTSGALAVSEFSLAKFFEYLDAEAGLNAVVTAAERTVKAATDKSGTIRLTREQVSGGVNVYELARGRARETNGTFIITSNEGDTVVAGPNGTGFDRTDPVAPNGSARNGEGGR